LDDPWEVKPFDEKAGTDQDNTPPFSHKEFEATRNLSQVGYDYVSQTLSDE
jgi:hypothetical protein